MSDSKIIFCGNSKDFLAEELTKASNAENGGTAFRIPSLVNADGTLVAIADKAATGSDWGYIELAVRTSADGGKTWTPIKTIAAPPAREINSSVENTKTAFLLTRAQLLHQTVMLLFLQHSSRNQRVFTIKNT